MIEEDICGDFESKSPLINAHTKLKAQVLFHGQQPPVFRSSESERFNLDSAGIGTGFSNIKLAAQQINAQDKNQTILQQDATPFKDKSSILATKPFLGGSKSRQKMGKSPVADHQRSFNGGYHLGNSDFNQSDMKFKVSQRDFVDNMSHPGNSRVFIDDKTYQAQEERKEDPMNDTSTSDFYQVPSTMQVGVPTSSFIKDGGRRPFTPPFSQLKKTNQANQNAAAQKTTTAKDTAVSKPIPNNLYTPKKALPTFIKGVMSHEQKFQLKKDLVIEDNQRKIEEPIEEEIDGSGTSVNLLKKKSQETE